MICDECQTVAHCMKNGCVPKTNVQQEPVAWRWKHGDSCWQFEDVQPRSPTAQPLYTSPPTQRKPLTDEEIIASNYPDGEKNGPTIAAPDFELICFARQIEAAHGIKENT